MKNAAVFTVLVLPIAVVLALPCFASDPGQPLDCSDWVFVESGLSMSPVVPYPCPVLGPRQTAPQVDGTLGGQRLWK